MKKLIFSMVALVFLATVGATRAQEPVFTSAPTIPIPNVGGGGITGDVTWGHSPYSSVSRRILSAELVDGKLIVERRFDATPSHIPLIGCYPDCDFTVRKVWKEIYAVRDGQIVLERYIEGTFVPAQKERIEYPPSK